MKSNFTFFFATLLLFSANFAASQNVPIPAQVQTQAILVRGATAHLGDGRVIENSVLAFENGKITVVDYANIKRLFPNHREIDASGKHLYPGLIAPSTQLGLQEIEQVAATLDNSEFGDLKPHIRSIIAYNTDSEITPTVRSMGVLMAEIVPQGGRISGSSSIVQLDAWNWEDAAIATDFALHLNWPSASRFNFRSRRVEKNEDYAKELRELEDYFLQAQAYHQKTKPETPNLAFQAMGGLYDGSKRLFVHADNVQSIQEAVLFAEKFQLAPVIVGGRDAWMITTFLKEHNVPIILGSTQSLPGREDDDVDQPFKTPALLQKAGVLYCFGHDGYWQVRNLAFQAGQAVPFGLTKEEALMGLTSNTAKILGIDKSVGTLEASKDATFFICEGDLLDMRTSKVTQAFIQGRELNLDNKQEILYRRFQAKYKTR